jgi:hypothetical protein
MAIRAGDDCSGGGDGVRKDREQYPAEYAAYHSMKWRCKPNGGLANYGGRGIRVCERWLESFDNFLADMGQRPSKFHSIERLDNDGNYEPENCVWATRRQQARNKRSNVFLRRDGKSRIVSDWLAESTISHATFTRRMASGWDVDRAISTPPRRKSSSGNRGSIFGFRPDADVERLIHRAKKHRGGSFTSIIQDGLRVALREYAGKRDQQPEEKAA